MKRVLNVIIFISAPWALAEEDPTAHHYFAKEPLEHMHTWDYAGEHGPEHWGCVGEQQSPIALDSKAAQPAQLPPLEIRYELEPVSMINNGHTIQHKGNPASFLSVGEKKYALEQYHLHSPSEHTLDGVTYPIEAHFVHKSQEGDVLVLGVFGKADEDGIAIHFLKDLPSVEGESVESKLKRSPADFLPKNLSYYTYPGSFTTPPCTENVKWIVLKDPVGIKPQLLERLVSLLNANHRPTQPLNSRVPKKSRF